MSVSEQEEGGLRYKSLYIKDWKQQTLRDSKLRVPLGLRMVDSDSMISALMATIMDKSVDTFEQDKRFLSASFRNFKKQLFCR